MKRTLEFDLQDAPMLVHALLIGANTAMMCGNKEAQKKLRAYGKMLEPLVPPEAQHFDPEVLAEIGGALQDASFCEVSFQPQPWNKFLFMGARLEVKIGERVWASNHRTYNVRTDMSVLEAVTQMLQEWAPLECVVNSVRPEQAA